jgi:N-acetylglutamate synthase/N-acetylornithine aminotransferase
LAILSLKHCIGRGCPITPVENGNTCASKVELSECTHEFQQALNEVTQALAHKIIKDGEGATKFVEICVKGGASHEELLH